MMVKIFLILFLCSSSCTYINRSVAGELEPGEYCVIFMGRPYVHAFVDKDSTVTITSGHPAHKERLKK